MQPLWEFEERGWRDGQVGLRCGASGGILGEL